MIKKVVVVGGGSMGRRRMRHAKQFTDAQVACWDIRADRRREVEDQFGVQTFASEQEIYAFAPDAMFISVPPSEHMHYIKKALELSIPFMVEQPIAHTLDHLDIVLKEVEAKKLICHVSCNQSLSPRVQTLKKVLDTGRLGKVWTGLVEIGEWLPDWHPYEPYQDYYPSRIATGGGLDAICDLDWLFYLFGYKIRDVKTTCSRRSSLDIDTDDIVQMILDFEDGPQLMLHTDMLMQPLNRQSRFICENGTLVHSYPDQFAKVYYADEKRWEQVPFEVDLSGYPTMQGKPQFNFAEPSYEADSLYFLNRLQANDPSMQSIQRGIDNLRFTLSQIRPEH